MGSEARTRLGLWFVLAIALLSFNQVFETGDYPGPALLGAGIATVIAIAARRLGLGSITSIGASLVGLLLYVVVIFEAKHSLWGLPTPEALVHLGRSLVRAWHQSEIDFAPVPIRPGYEVMIVATLWTAATIGELASFRWRRPVLAVLIPIVLTSVATVVGTGTAAPLLVIALLAALLVYWALESTHRLRSWGRWVSAWAHHRDAEPDSLAGGLARRMGATCLAAALVSPLFLPALGDGMFSWRSGIGSGAGNGSGDGSGGVNPWVSIAPRLIEQSDDDLFRVKSKEPAYWRVASLDIFNGVSWESEGDDRETVEGGSGRVAGVARPPLTHSEDFQQTIEVIGLDGEALPSAPVPAIVHRVEDEGESADGLSFDPFSGNLFASDDLDEGDRFEVTSTLPNVGYKELVDAQPGRPGTIAPRYFETGVTITPTVDDLVRVWTAGAASPYEQLVAIQTELRRFEYSLDPPKARSNDLVTDFLLRSRTGFCQQFSSAFAVLARHLGYPSRVSVGYLPGERDPVTRTAIVRGNDAHAWPEIYFEQYGWIAFEPTPRGDVGALPPAYTSEPIPGLRSDPNDPFGDLFEGRSGQGLSLFGSANPREIGGRDPISADGRPLGSPGGGGPMGLQAWQETFGRLLTWLAVAALAFLVAVPLLKELRTRRRYAAAGDPDSLAEAAFIHFQEEASELAVQRQPWESASAYASKMRALGRVADNSAQLLAQIYESAAYAARDISPQQADEAKRLATRLRGQLWSRASWIARALRLFSPRRLGLR